MNHFKVRQVLNLIPNELMSKIGKETEVDKVNQQLTGKTVFYVMLLSLCETSRLSLRAFERMYNSAIFKNFLPGDPIKKQPKGTHSSFADRLSKINPQYFANIFNHLVNSYHQTLPQNILNKIYAFDSTLISISSKLFDGLNCGGGGDKNSNAYIKIVVGLKGLIPSSVHFCKDRSEVSDSAAIANAIAEATIAPNDIIIFDRGGSWAKLFDHLSSKCMSFVSRIRQDRTYKVIKDHYIRESREALEVGCITSDQTIQLLFSKKNKRNHIDTQFRLIKVVDKDHKEIWILTNIFDLSALDISEIYRRRWDIEVFFRFIKQELSLKHFLARNMNGMMVHIYMILILATLLMIYKTTNHLKGYKWVKYDFLTGVENEVIADIIVVSGGNPNIFLERFCFL